MWLTRQIGLGLILKLAQLVEKKAIAIKALKELPGLKSEGTKFRRVRELSSPRVGRSFTAQNGKPRERFQKQVVAIGDWEHPSALKRGLSSKLPSQWLPESETELMICCGVSINYLIWPFENWRIMTLSDETQCLIRFLGLYSKVLQMSSKYCPRKQV